MNSAHSSWNNRSVLVTGGAGFIGSWLAHGLIDADANVYILDKKKHLPQVSGHYEVVESKATYIQGDVRDGRMLADVLTRHKIQTVFHLAAEAIVGNAYSHPSEALDTNIRGTWTVLDAVRQTNPEIEVVIASSDKAYGAHETLPYTEDFPLIGNNPYDSSKSAADLIAQMYIHTYGMPVSITRCGNVYGGGDFNFSRLIPDTIRSLLQGKPPVIRSDGLYIRDYVHVRDIVSAYMSAGDALITGKTPHSILNFGTGAPQRALDIVSAVTRLMGMTLKPTVLNEARYEIRDQYLDSTRAREILGWNPRISLEAGLSDTISWYKEYFRENDSSSVV